MKDKVNQLFRDKLILVTVVLGLVAIVAAAGTATIRKGNTHLEESPYLELQESDGLLVGEYEHAQTIGNSNATEAAEVQTMENTMENEVQTVGHEPVAETEVLEAGAIVSESLVLDFSETEKLAWPVMGNVILGYSMDKTTWFPTLEQYKCNPANVIQSDISTPVVAPADARILEVGYNEEIGNFLRLDLGNEYTAVCGQLKEIPVVENEYLHKGELLGYVAEPTKYYSVEGVNVYFELQHAGKPVDSLDFLE
ncbi:MAG: M23 family metallopeptidase [Lachnospiraceae bacterium]|nr:M23 family metallopeptidase [Lachnospiraceae bacterium]